MYCPSCGQQTFSASTEKSFQCRQCDFTYFHNSASAVLAIIKYQDDILVAIRGREPGKGMWDFPGGFVDHDESLEQALFRELEEELKFQTNKALYFGSYPNTYQYKNITYKTCDAFFVIELEQKPVFSAGDDVEAVQWVNIAELEPEKLAFTSARQALALYLAK
ncbi:NUDIX domain-containing protein [Photobacterium sp. SDRW27]|uniref:NUDIX hydrolase n=1 Tax=Photobacterium obscurum TaxID=2829490 RepID=UPI002243BE1C|nr:NUDIX domain-containing protein [Photobacterium obscurum]MCW8331147.1 NUDIX domain-containing protein [Photobacterium obscurum]